MICTDETICRLIVHNDSQSISQQTETHYDVMTHLRSYASLCQYVDTFVIQRDDGEVFTSVRGYEDDYKVALQQSWYQDYILSGKNGAFTEMHRFFTPYGSIYEDGISYVLRYLNLKDYTYEHIIAEVRWSYFKKLLTAYDNSHARLYYLNENGQVLDATQPSLPQDVLQTLLQTGYTESNGMIYLSTSMQHPAWTLLLMVDRASLQREMMEEMWRYLFLEVLLFAVILLVSTSLLYKKTRPIQQLKGAMEAISQGNLDTRLSIHTGDEFELLGNGMNEMAIHLKAYIQQLLDAEKDKRKMQSDLLLLQIKPHFIYNTLNSATYLIEEGRNDSAIHMIHSLIALLQETVHSYQADSLNGIYPEIQIQIHYLDIQSLRYPQRFRFETHVGNGLDDCLIPRMILQPLIENALLHGIVPADHPCVLSLSFTRQEDRVRIEVRDDGVGMDERRLSAVMQQGSKESAAGQGVAIHNIMRRLDLVYGAGNASLTLQSIPGKGTTAVLLMPICNEKEAPDDSKHIAAG